MSETGTIQSEIREAHARIVLNYPRRCNALTMSMLETFDGTLAAIEADPAVRVVTVEGVGERFFCAGADVSEWGQLSPEAMGRRWIRAGNRVFQRLAELDVTVIALINGDALGGGLELALAADLRVAVQGIRIGFPETAIGAIPGWLGCSRLQTVIGPGRARQLILTGEPISAEQAESWGLINEVVPRERLPSRAAELAQLLASRSPVSIAAAKRLLNAGIDDARHAAMHELAATACMGSADGAEGLAAFRAKRKPVFPGGL